VGLFRKSLSFVALGLASGGYARVDTVLLSVVASPATVGLYAAAYRLMGPLQLFLSAFGTVFFSRASRARGVGADWRHLNRRGQVVLLIVLTPLVVVGVVVAPLAVRLLFGPSYGDAALPARILLITMIPVAWSWPSGHTLNALDRQHVWILILLAGILLDAVLVLSLGHALGATGAAIAWLVVEAATVGWVGIGMRHISSSRRTAVAREFDAGPSAITSDPRRPS
jgi:O-antigen/teichoic acid export membrane protein